MFAFLLMTLLVGIMAVGVIFGRQPISGSCGGMKALGMEMECEICGGDLDKCKNPDVDSSSPESLSQAKRVGN